MRAQIAARHRRILLPALLELNFGKMNRSAFAADWIGWIIYGYLPWLWIDYKRPATPERDGRQLSWAWSTSFAAGPIGRVCAPAVRGRFQRLPEASLPFRHPSAN